MTLFTRREKYVLILLAVGLACGAGYSYYKQFHLPLDIRFHDMRTEKRRLRRLDRLLRDERSVNINKASFDELGSLRGIGPALARRIMTYRRDHGGFERKEDLKKVRGIGDKKFEAVKDYILIE